MGRPQIVARDSILTNPNNVEFEYDSLTEAFPIVEPGLKPLGTTCLFQIRHPKKRSKGGIILTEGDRSTEYYNTQVAKVIAVGPLCFKTIKETAAGADGIRRDVIVEYADGPWFRPGDFVRLPKYGGDRFSVSYTRVDFETDPDTGRKEKVSSKDDVIFALFKAKDVLGLVTSDPLAIRAFLD